MVRLLKLVKHLFLTLHRHNIHCQQRELSKFLMSYQQFASHAYCGAAGPVCKKASQQEKAFSVCSILRCPYLWLQCGVEFCARFKKIHYCVVYLMGDWAYSVLLEGASAAPSSVWSRRNHRALTRKFLHSTTRHLGMPPASVYLSTLFAHCSAQQLWKHYFIM
jgi:hypothetical protein